MPFDKLRAHQEPKHQMRPEPAEGQLAALCVDLGSCPQPQSSRLATSEPIRIIGGCLGSTFFVAPMTRSMSAALVILNRDCSSMRLVVSTHSRRVVDRLRSLGRKNVSTLRTRTCLNTRSRDGGEKKARVDQGSLQRSAAAIAFRITQAQVGPSALAGVLLRPSIGAVLSPSTSSGHSYPAYCA